MALLDENCCECLKSELDLSSVPNFQSSIERNRYEAYYPVTTLSANGPIEFQILSGDQDYLDLQKSYVYLKCRILEHNSTALDPPGDQLADAVPAKSTVYPINYFVATQFKAVEVFLSGKQITASDSMYAYRAYIETLLSYSKSKEEQLQCGLFYKACARKSTKRRASILEK